MPKKKGAPKKKPPLAPIKSVQMDLFSQFVTNEPSEVSNTVEFWDSIPKYFLNSEQQKKLRTAEGLAKPYKWQYIYNGAACEVRIQPALIEQEDGRYKAFFPSGTEELVEEALKKILADQRYAIHDPQQAETWVRFTLRMIQKELKIRGRSRSIAEIKQAIEIMSSSILAFYRDGKEIWKGSILQDLVTVDREDYKADTNAHHIGRLPLFISHAINSLEYRQFNYDRLMRCDDQLACWILKTKLIPRFTQAGLFETYHHMYSDLKQSGLLQQAKERQNRAKALTAHDELVQRGVLASFEAQERKEGRKIVDVKYTLFPSMEFVREQKAANKRKTNQITEAKLQGMRVVDK